MLIFWVNSAQQPRELRCWPSGGASTATVVAVGCGVDMVVEQAQRVQGQVYVIVGCWVDVRG
jgi:hypothetical protein